ncbi:MAG: hypothetical protein K2X50_08920 [Gammaproteobacteria bacterium]|nr:hypothetical protein [Gammaproteobacteria bacterium]
MVARICKYCLSATLLATATMTTTAMADYTGTGCTIGKVADFIYPPSNCAYDRAAPAMHGPFQLTIDYADRSGWTIDPKYINELGPRDALSLEFAFGTKVFRAASTYGRALTNDVFFKLSAEYFAQQPTFNFISGDIDQWMGQWDFGGDLQYRIHGQLGIDSFHLGLQYIKAQNKGLPNLPFVGGTDVRNLVGGTEVGAALGVRIQPWASGYFDLDLYYDENNYKRTFQKDDDAIGFGAGAAYHQNIGEKFQFVISGMDRRPYYEYEVGVKWIARHSIGSLLELGTFFSTNGGDTSFGKENRLGLGLFYSWGGDMYSAPVVYNDPLNRGLRQEIVDYTNIPAVRPPQILVTSDEGTFP